MSKKNVNLTLPSNLIEKAKDLHVNLSEAAEMGILQKLKKVQEDEWKRQNQLQIRSYNQRIEEKGTLLVPDWIDKE